MTPPIPRHGPAHVLTAEGFSPAVSVSTKWHRPLCRDYGCFFRSAKLRFATEKAPTTKGAKRLGVRTTRSAPQGRTQRIALGAAGKAGRYDCSLADGLWFLRLRWVCQQSDRRGFPSAVFLSFSSFVGERRGAFRIDPHRFPPPVFAFFLFLLYGSWYNTAYWFPLRAHSSKNMKKCLSTLTLRSSFCAMLSCTESKAQPAQEEILL